MDLLIRYLDKYPDVNTLEEHSKVLKKEGAVWFGKIGRKLADNKLKAVRKDCDGRQKPKLFLARLRGPGQGYNVHKATIADLTADTPKERSLIPGYYKELDILPHVTLWIKIESLEAVEDSVLEKLVIAKSRNPAPEALKHSIVSLFLVDTVK